MKISLPAALLLLVPFVLRGEVIHVDFNADLTNGVAELQWDYGEGFLSRSSGYQFSKLRAPVTSPTFPVLAITNVVLSVGRTASATNKYIRVTPLDAQGSTIDALSRTNAYSTLQSFSWEPADGVNRLSIQMDGGNSGQFYLRSADIHAIAPVERPDAVRTGNLYANAFAACWTNPGNATANTLCVTQRIVTASAYTAPQGCSWNFSSVTNLKGSAESIDGTIGRNFPGLTGKVLQIAANTNGYIQIGKSSALGELIVTNVNSECSGVLFHAAKCYDKDNRYGNLMPVFLRTEDGSTNILDVVTLSSEPSDFYLPLPRARAQTDELVLSSTTNHMNVTSSGKYCTVNLYSVALVTDYVPAATNHLALRTERFPARNRFLVRDLTPGTYEWFVTAEAADGTVSKPSALQTVTLTPDMTPWKDPGLFLRIR